MRRMAGDIAEASKYILGTALVVGLCLVTLALAVGLFVRVFDWAVGW